ncbi:peptidoglycan-binding protein [Jiangella anatolica]|uniref:Peptidoglycan-binding protein n=2 Tax=Jiangella anatolica TaxID=2670374 RepID=A0A2W2B3K6_9ACTN|nr:peptidoglycan-binding protein [Jiangella anatolica]
MTEMDTSTDTRAHDLGDHRPRRGRRLLWLTLGVVAVAGPAYWLMAQRTPADEAATAPTGPAATATVELTTIAATQTWDGTLGRGAPVVVTAAAQGTVTRIAAPDTAVARGTELYRLNERPVVALIGTIPMYRDLGEGDTGADVEQLEANLTALGYDGYDVDEEFTWYTAQAVEEWQEDLGIDETGTVGLADVVFLAGGGRVDTVAAAVGTALSPGGQVLEITGTDQVADLEVEVGDRDLVPVGTAVTVRLAGGLEVPGTVTAAAVVPSGSGDDGADTGSDDASGSTDAVTEVEVTLAEAVDEALIGSPVDVVAAVDTRENVLVVPVNALLTLAEGGFGLEVVADDGTTSVVAIEAGLFADGMVEVSGAGIEAGTVVGVAGR